jgi:hypothetical protein
MEQAKKPFLVDVPVKTTIWIRPDCQRKQFEIIKKARPSILFIQSDGGRNEKEWAAIRKNREMFDTEIDWDCKVFRMYEDHNLGMYAMAFKTRDVVWSNVDRCIFMEDDILPSVSFFRYCAELLEKYKDDQRIECICGMNHLGKSENVKSDYFFSRQGSIWGTATWKRVIDERGDYTYGEDPYTMKTLRQRTRRNEIAWKRLSAYSKQAEYEGHVASAEFWHEFNMYAQNRLQIIPKVNMISNIGCTESSAHAAELDQLPKGIRRVFNMKTYEMEFPMKHPKYVMPDIEYEKKRNRIMGYNTPVINLGRKTERVFLMMKNGKFKEIIKKVKGKREVEK